MDEIDRLARLSANINGHGLSYPMLPVGHTPPELEKWMAAHHDRDPGERTREQSLAYHRMMVDLLTTGPRRTLW